MSQFQHLQAALTAAEKYLHSRWTSNEDRSNRSIWLMFGDDDDLWHPRRVATLVEEVTEHPLLDCTAVFVTFERANLETSELRPGEALPVNAREVDRFLRDGLATLNSEETDVQEWLTLWKEAGRELCDIAVPDGLNLEYFDFCPRFRVMKEFFDATSPELLAHRFCDLRCAEFFLKYPSFGREKGMELHFFESSTWLYFYAHKGVTGEDWGEACEGIDAADDCRPRSVGFEDGHVSSSVTVASADVHLARNRWKEFHQFDAGITASRLSRYLAHFRFNLEMYLIRFHRQVIDQPAFSELIIDSVKCSFPGYMAALAYTRHVQAAEKLVFDVCFGIAKCEALRFEVTVIWIDRDKFILPGPYAGACSLEEEESGGDVPDSEDSTFQVTEGVLQKWSDHLEATCRIQRYTLEAAWGEATRLRFVEALELLQDLGLHPEALIHRLVQDEDVGKECQLRRPPEQQEDRQAEFQEQALDLLRELLPDAAARGCLTLDEVYALLEAQSFSVHSFVHTKRIELFGHAKTDIDNWPLLGNFQVIFQLLERKRSSLFLCQHPKTYEMGILKWPVNPAEVSTVRHIQKQTGHFAAPRILASGDLQDKPYLVSQVMGSDLVKVFQRLAECTLQIRWTAVRLLGRMLLRRLEAVHSCGYVHCNVSPENVVIGRWLKDAGLAPLLVDFGCALKYEESSPVTPDHGTIEFGSLRSAGVCVRLPQDDVESLGWMMVYGVAGCLPWSSLVQEFAALKPALQKVKMQRVIAQVHDSKARLLKQGWPSLGPEWSNISNVPSALKLYMQRCQVASQPDYQKLAELLGADDGSGRSTDSRDMKELAVALEPVFNLA